MRMIATAWRGITSSLFARSSLILLIGLVVAQLASFWLQAGERNTMVMQARGQNFADRIAEAVRVLESTTPAQIPTTLTALQSKELHVMLIHADQVASNSPRGQFQAMLASRLGSVREVRSPSGAAGIPQRDSPMRVFDIRLADGQWVRITATSATEAPALPANLITQLLIIIAFVMVAVMLALRQVSQPLHQLAAAADTLGRDLDAPPLAEIGSSEMRSAAQSFNRMQARIRRLIAERSRALAAVSHDLRTPLTRLRLRAELIEDKALRDQMAADLNAMAVMLDSALTYLRGLQDSEPVRLIDMNALLQSMAEDAEVLGQHIPIEGRAAAPYSGRLLALQRALQNLLDNAIKYGQSARLRLEDAPDELRITVQDSGPGIPVEELERVTEPFYRPDAARNSATGGVGLGLSIVKDVALLHGGSLTLANAPTGGLAATLILPRHA